MLYLWEMRSTPSFPLLLDPLWPGVVAPDRMLSLGQIELLDIWTESKTNDLCEMNLLETDFFYYLTMCKQMTNA